MFIAKYPKIRTSESATHVYFGGGPLSQWSPHGFNAEIDAGDFLYVHFHCAKQYMMAQKAKLFEDYATMEKIIDLMPVEDDPYFIPRKSKQLGRMVRNFDETHWVNNRCGIALEGNVCKFSNSHAIRKYLLSTEDKVLVGASSLGRIWGAGLAWDDEAVLDEANWNGLNLLGNQLTIVRKMLRG